MAQVADALTTGRPGLSLESQRACAEAVLAQLIEAKSACEQESGRTKRLDLYKSVTGRSAFDTAIASTRRMIDALDRSLGESTMEIEVRAGALLARQKPAAR